MGPAQAMSYTWQGLKDRVANLLSKGTVSPWEYEDACVFAGAHLSDPGHSSSAQTKLCADEAIAVWHYVGGHMTHAYNIVETANLIANIIGEEPCTASATPPTPGPQNGWQLPIHGHTVLSSTAADHIIPSRHSYLAWDLTAPYDTPVYPVAAGTVINAYCTSPITAGYGCWIQIDHGVDANGNRIYSGYAHLTNASTVSIGDPVTQDTVIGHIGCTGLTSFGPHTHFQIWSNGQLVDPQNVFGNWTSIGLAYSPFCLNLACLGQVPRADPTGDPCFQ